MTYHDHDARNRDMKNREMIDRDYTAVRPRAGAGATWATIAAIALLTLAALFYFSGPATNTADNSGTNTSTSRPATPPSTTGSGSASPQATPPAPGPAGSSNAPAR